MELESSVPRLDRLKDVNWQYPVTKYRKALKSLLHETDNRCGYSLQHVSDLGEKSMEVDHFNPKLKHPRRNRHGNLIAASRHCNGAKSDIWPNEEDRRNGLYIINPYEEADYGNHIIEERDTGLLIGKTTAGKWQIEILDLNAAHLITKRLDRTALLNTFLSAALASGADSSNELIKVVLAKLVEVKARILPSMIPELPTA